MDIVVHKFQHLRKDGESDEFIAVDNPDVISFTPMLRLLVGLSARMWDSFTKRE